MGLADRPCAGNVTKQVENVVMFGMEGRMVAAYAGALALVAIISFFLG